MKSFPIPVTTTTTPATPAESLANTLRWCKDIGMFALDRSIEASCVHRTEFCEKFCFNNKLMAAFGHSINPKDQRNESAWANNDSGQLQTSLTRKRKQTGRIRFMTRGEALATVADIDRVENIVRDNPDSVFWMPTRAWRDTSLFAAAQKRLDRYPNIRILASMDPSNDKADWDTVVDLGLSTMYFDKQINPKLAPTGQRWFKCPKTHKHLDGHCAKCKGGCFRTSKRVDIHLKQH